MHKDDQMTSNERLEGLFAGKEIDYVKDCQDSPCGYIVSTGCDIPLNSPMENVYAFMDGVRKFVKCPLDPKNFSE